MYVIYIRLGKKTLEKALAWLEGLAISGSMALGARNTCLPCVPYIAAATNEKGGMHTRTHMCSAVEY
jgi:hypothetical protein